MLKFYLEPISNVNVGTFRLLFILVLLHRDKS